MELPLKGQKQMNILSFQMGDRLDLTRRIEELENQVHQYNECGDTVNADK